MEIWFQDEARIGQQGSLSRIWAKRGTRPRVVRQQQFISQHIYGAVCPQGRKAASIVATGVCAKAMQLHLDEISLHISAGKHAILAMDRAGWHRSKSLRIPENISFLYLPPSLFS